MDAGEIEELVIQTLEDVLDGLGREQPAQVDGRTVVFGADGLLDSMGLVALITDLEERIENDLGRSVVLADERAMSRERSPFRTVERLAQHVVNRAAHEEQVGDG
jgi:acyl carrier protein